MIMDETVKNQIRNCCLEKEAAPCVSACPFHFDVREFVPKAGRGAFNSAYRAYANAVTFPRIVSQICGEPCRAGCPLKDRGGAVNLKLIEQAVVKSATLQSAREGEKNRGDRRRRGRPGVRAAPVQQKV